MKKKILAAVLVTACLLLSVSAFFGCSPAPADIKHVQLDGDEVRVGIISDTQLAHTPDYDFQYLLNLVEALQTLKARNANVILFAGDFANLVTDYMYQSFQSAWNFVYGEEEKKGIAPEKVFIMGNHDYWFEHDYQSTVKKQQMFQKYTGESPWSHKVIGGYHFIAFSPTSGNSYKDKVDWFKKQVEIAEADGDKPYFVVTHHNPRNTVYGSEYYDDEHQGWGFAELDDLFKGHERLISISGHSHYALSDERSIYQNSYTAIQTQSLAYIELDPFRENGSIPPHADENPMGMFMRITSDKIDIERIRFRDNESEGQNWIINLPLKQSSFTYTDARKDQVSSPVMQQGEIAAFSQESEVKIDGIKQTANRNFIRFPAATVEGNTLVYTYKIELTRAGETKTYLYFSDFYLGRSNMQSEVSLMLNKDLESGEYQIKITAQESFGKWSENSLVSNISIVKPEK